jgi:uncharacterized membrane protein (UPF0127 family)
MAVRDGDKYTLRLGNTYALFRVEVAVTPEALAQGLSGRAKLDPGHGMLFIFPELKQQSMWMPDMRFPLDIVWLDENMTVVHITENAPPCPSRAQCPAYGSKFMAKYAIEMTAGQARSYGFTEGIALRVLSV